MCYLVCVKGDEEHAYTVHTFAYEEDAQDFAAIATMADCDVLGPTWAKDREASWHNG